MPIKSKCLKVPFGLWKSLEVAQLNHGVRSDFEPIIAPSRSKQQDLWPKVFLLNVSLLNVLNSCLLLES